MQLTLSETWVSGNLTAPTERSQRAIRWTQYGFYQGEAHGFTKEKLLHGDQNGQNGQRVACKIGMFTRPKDKTILSFSGSPRQWPWQGCCCNLPRESNAVRRSCVSPPNRHYRHCPSLDHSPSFASIRLSYRAVLTSAGLEAADQMAACWAGFTSPVAMCVYGVCAFVLLRCFSCSHTVLPKEHSLGVIFFSSLSSVLCWIFLQFYLHFTTDYTLYDCVCDE